MLPTVHDLYRLLKHIEQQNDVILSQLKEFRMSVAQDLKDLTKKIDDATNAVAARLDALAQQITNSMSDADVTAVKAGLQAEVDKLTALGSDPNNPIPPAP